MTILNKYKRWNTLLKVNQGNVWDFIISNKKKNVEILSGDKLCAFIDVSNSDCVGDDGCLFSHNNVVWNNAINSNVQLRNIGLTAIDSGYINFRGDVISNEEFFNILTNTTLKLEENDLRLQLRPVNSNNNIYDFSYSFEKENGEQYIKLNGGFFQGFFKIYGDNYQVLPTVVDDGWYMEFLLRPRDYDVTHNSLNGIHRDNKGIFFYMGTRSENKFLAQYNYDFSDFEKREVESSIDLLCDNFYNGYYFENFADINSSETTTHFKEDNYLNVNYNEYNEGYFLDKDYLLKEKDISNEVVYDTNKIETSVEGYYEFKTDNKFLFFDHTKDGLTTDKWDEEDEVIISGSKTPNSPNLYLYLDNTTNGFNADNINDLYKSMPLEKVDFNDITNNAFALKINDYGGVGYRYLIDDCEMGYKVIEEYSKPNIIKNDEWNRIGVSIEPINGYVDDCENEYGKRTMKIRIYIDGKLKFISKELPLFNFREINEYKTKQEGVPYNISLGGGTMGLSNSMWTNYYSVFNYVFPLEKYFGGSFIGDIKSFKFFTNKLSYPEIVGIEKK